MAYPAAQTPPVAATPPAATPVIAMMEDHFVVNMVVRSRDKAKALRRMIEMAEGMLPESAESDASKQLPVSNSATNSDVADGITDSEGGGR